MRIPNYPFPCLRLVNPETPLKQLFHEFFIKIKAVVSNALRSLFIFFQRLIEKKTPSIFTGVDLIKKDSTALLAEDYLNRHGILVFVSQARDIYKEYPKTVEELTQCCRCKERFWSVILKGDRRLDELPYTYYQIRGLNNHVIPVICHDDGKKIQVLIMDSIGTEYSENFETYNYLAELLKQRPNRKIVVGHLAGIRQADHHNCEVDAFVMVRDAYRELQSGRKKNLYEVAGVDSSAFTLIRSSTDIKQALDAPYCPLPSCLAKTVQRLSHFPFPDEALVHTKKGPLTLKAFRVRYLTVSSDATSKLHQINTYLSVKAEKLAS